MERASVPDLHKIRHCVSAGSAPFRINGLKNTGSSNSNLHLSTRFDFCKSFCISASLCQEGVLLHKTLSPLSVFKHMHSTF